MGSDPIFGGRVPLLFAHRGGAGEVPESTVCAFQHAVDHGTDVLELDVRLTRDGELVVWHGPSLERAHDGSRRLPDREIWALRWPEINGNVWVVHPERPGDLIKTEDRLLMSLEEFCTFVHEAERALKDRGAARTLHLNIELKKSKRPAPTWCGRDTGGRPIWEKLFDILGALAPKAGAGGHASRARKIVVASANAKIIRRFRNQCRQRDVVYSTNVAGPEQAAALRLSRPLDARLVALIAAALTRTKSLRGAAFETSHALVSKRLSDHVHKKGGGIYPFLTAFSFRFPAIDHLKADDLRGPLFRLLNLGVDGVMTDFPAKVRPLLDQWSESRRTHGGKG